MLTYNKVFILIISLCLSTSGSLAQGNITFSGKLEKNVFGEIILNRWQDTLAFMLSVDSSIDYMLKEAIKDQLHDFILPFKEKNEKKKNKRKLIRRLSRQVGEKYLKNYSKFSNFSQTVSHGKYDCLTSTILYSYIFEKLQLNYSIWETNYHIYLMVHLPKQDILIEPTDPVYGVICGEKNIKTRLEAYRKANEKKVDTFLAEYRIERKVNFKQLLALQYYNKAVDQFNHKDFKAAMNTIKKSILVYDCDRNRGFINYSKKFAISESMLK